MMIRSPAVDLTIGKELKIKVPLGHHIRLHSIKLITGKQISEVVADALTDYFARAQAAEDAVAEG